MATDRTGAGPLVVAGAVDVHRLACRLLLLGLLAFSVPAALRLRAQADRVPAWWSAVVLLVVLLAVLAAVRGRDRWAALTLWAGTVGGALSLPLVVDGTLEGPAWLGVLSPVVIASTVLLSRRAVVCAVAVATVLLAGTVAHHGLVPDPPRPTVEQLAMLVALWVGSLALLRSLQLAQRRVEAVQDDAVDEFVSARAAEATVRAEQAWDAYLHDEVMASLVRIGDGDVVTARQEARRVLQERWTVGRAVVPTPWIGAGALDVVMAHRPDAGTVVDVRPGVEPVPDEVRRAVLEALSEALRNVGRHAYEPTGEGPSQVLVRLDDQGLRVVVADEGRGFDHRLVAESRMGMALSIHARMDAVGGWSRIDSAPGRGTTVELGWGHPVPEAR